MASLGNPRTWIPYLNSKDCSNGFCSSMVYHPPPPPPQPFELYPEDHDSSPTSTFSPLVVAIIGILATAFLLVTYYAVISKYCSRRGRHSSRESHDDHELHMIHEPWHVLVPTCTGLDEALINSITVCKYKRPAEGTVTAADCSVCLTEFEDGDSVRLLPKCGHAFHLPCIDTWLKSHSTCPLCRAAIFSFNASTMPPVELPSSENEFAVVVEEEGSIVHGNTATTTTSDHASKNAMRAFSDLGNMQGRHRIIEIRDEVLMYDESIGIRSVSMDHSF